MRKRIVGLLLALALCAGMSVPALAAGRTFSDVPTSFWAYNEIAEAVKEEIASGYSDGTFKPGNSVTNAHFAAFLARAFYPYEVDLTTIKEWYSPYTNVLEAHDLLKGTCAAADLAAYADQPISRYDMARLMYNILVDKGGTAPSDSKMKAAQNAIGDWNSIPASYQDAVAACYALGVLNGQSDGTFGGNKNMNRAQACVVIGRLDKYISNVIAYVDESAWGKTLANGKAATVENVLEILAQVEKEYPTGTGWGGARSPDGHGGYRDTTAPDNHYYVGGAGGEVGSLIGSFGDSSTMGCGGFAAMVSDRIFGKTGAPVRVLEDHTAVRPGDIIQYVNINTGITRHWAVAVSQPDNNQFGNFQTADGNTVIDGIGYVSWPNEYSSGIRDEILSDSEVIIIYTRYRDAIADAATSEVTPWAAVEKAIEIKKAAVKKALEEAVDIRCANCGFLMQKAGSQEFDTNGKGFYMCCDICHKWFLCGQCASEELLNRHMATCKG